MGLELSKLNNVRESDEKTTAQCPACFENGGDRKGEHLVIYPSGGYGCVTNTGDKEHYARIFKLAGSDGREEGVRVTTHPKVEVRPYVPPAKRVLLEFGREGHLFSILSPKEK